MGVPSAACSAASGKGLSASIRPRTSTEWLSSTVTERVFGPAQTPTGTST
jgi:hypothetical protein